jgi:hypothetical protein
MRVALAALVAGLLGPSVGLAQTVILDPPMIEGEVMIAPAPLPGPMVGPPTMEDARLIAMTSGVVVVEDVDRRIWDGNWEVEGEDAYGEDIEVVIDSETGAVLRIDD